MDRKKITERNREVLSFLKAANTPSDRFPSPEELHAAFGGKGASLCAENQLSALRRRRLEQKIRFNAVLSIAGTIPAGYGEPAEPADLGSIPVDLELLNIKAASRAFALKVRGDSMIGAQIADGDMVIVEAREPKIGEIVAALIDGETTLKRFVMEDGLLFLKAENPQYPDLIPLREMIIQGVVRAVVRVCESPRGGR